MIRLVQFNPAFGLPNASPFCMKLETYLRMTGLPYEAPALTLSLMGKAPKGKLPYIEDGGQRLADSSLIIDYLKATYGDPLDGWLSAEQKALALAFQRLLEENTYWAVMYTRWVEPEGWAVTRPAFFADLPWPLKWIVPGLARRGLIKQLWGQGMGRHSRDEIMAIGQRDLSAVANHLGSQAYFMGEQPSSVDAVAFAFVANVLWAPLDTPIQRHGRQFPQLEAYCQRMRDRYFNTPRLN